MAEPVRVRGLTDREGQKLQQIVRRGSSNSVRYRRAMMLPASAGGNRVPVIAQLVRADEDTVREVIHRCNEIGLACLDPRWAGDRPRLLTPEDEDFVVATATTRPTKLGRPFTRWPIRKLAAFLRRVHGRVIRIGREALRCLLLRRGITYFHGCYSIGDDRLWGVNRRRKGSANSLSALKSIRAARSDGAPIHIILDNLSAHTGADIRRRAKKNKVELCFTPTYASWANPIEAHFGPLRQFTLADSHHRSHPAQARALHRYLRRRNTNARHPDVLAARRKERARVRSEKGIRWGGRPLAA
ncbi:helix-turn-helix domain-containing protein [Streptomyces kebangsaanensis]|uniref:Helix-turn-helix domain-containing protein n=1 Tax=Streptomyces kebangsaanensis TaxID=864058 RepID=A0ABW6L300_9ACTN